MKRTNHSAEKVSCISDIKIFRINHASRICMHLTLSIMIKRSDIKIGAKVKIAFFILNTFSKRTFSQSQSLMDGSKRNNVNPCENEKVLKKRHRFLVKMFGMAYIFQNSDKFWGVAKRFSKRYQTRAPF